MTVNIPRRDILKAGLPIAGVLALAPLASPARAASALGGQPITDGSVSALAAALRAIGGDVCDAAARGLETLPDSATRFTLHLRRAGLDGAAATRLAGALHALKTGDGAALNSFSLSYNAGIGDAGASLIAQSLPTSLPELGMVGCDLGEPAGEALFRWATRSTDLHTMCIEQNRFSDGLKARFNGLARQRTNLFMMV